jgi:RNA polymerase sigma-70 factor (ECF subfamily)
VLASWPQQPAAEIDALVVAALARAQRAWPTVTLDEEGFLRYLIDRLPRDVPFAEALEAIHAGDLYLACACGQQLPEAMVLFERQLMRAIEGTIARIDPSTDFRDEVRQRLRERVLTGDPPRICDYNGVGPLEGWLRVAALRLALNTQREIRRNAQLRVNALPPRDPELEAILCEHREQVEASFRSAFSHLRRSDRELLRLHYLEGVSFEEMGARRGVDRSTASRRVAAARQLLLEETHRELAKRVPAATTTSRDSLLQALRSQIDLSLESVLKS